MMATQSHDKSIASESVFVDLDGTLIRSDMLLESLCALLRRRPHFLLFLPFWLASGRARLKQELARRVSISAEYLPYNQQVIDFLNNEKKIGRQLVLATASDRLFAEKVAAHLQMFDHILASNGDQNLKGREKLKLIEEFSSGQAFCYIGDSRADIPIWEAAARQVIVCGNSGRGSEAIHKKFPQATLIEHKKTGLRAYIKALRLYQWVKNLLIFVPLVMAHQVLATDVQGFSLMMQAILAFLAFGCCSSAVYLINDLCDLEADRQHPRKRFRPFASGEISIARGVALVPSLLALSLLLSAFVPLRFVAVLGIYFALTLAYSFYIKQLVLVDIIVLALLYTIRIIAGGMAVSVPVSQWLLAFSMFFFFSLACVKRFSELFMLRKNNQTATRGRGYIASDLEQVAQFGSSSGFISVLVLALYINSREVIELYSQPRLLWLICPLLLYWISRVWLLAQRGLLHEDPIVFAITDKASYVVGTISALLVFWAI